MVREEGETQYYGPEPVDDGEEKGLKAYLEEKYPSRLSSYNFKAFGVGALLFFVSSLAALLSGPRADTYTAGEPSIVLVFIVMASVSGLGIVVWAYMIYRRYKKRKEAMNLIYEYVHKGGEEKEVANLVGSARYFDRGSLYDLLNVLSKEGILEKL